MPKLLFFDIDGTLLDEKTFKLPGSVVRALNKARENDCLIFLNTGRTLCNLDKQMSELPLDGMSLGCGTRVIYRIETLCAAEYTHEDSLRLLDIYRKLKIPTVYECDTALYFDPKGADHKKMAGFKAYADKAGNRRDIREDDPEFLAVKMFCFIDSDEQRERLLAELKGAEMPFYAIDRGEEGWELVPEGSTKAGGIDIIRERVGASIDDCYVFGDSRNDLTMLTHVKNSVAMGQAPDDVKKLCSYVTDTPMNDGIEKALKALKLI